MQSTMTDLSKIKSEADIRRVLCDRTRFEQDVYVATSKIPKGKVSTYGRIAKKIGLPKAYRAVASALRKNPLHPVVPCHRVVKNDGSFGGDPKRAADRRKQVIEEGITVRDGQVQLADDILY